MDEKIFEDVQLELAALVRNITSVTSDKTLGLDRSGYLILHHLIENGAAGTKAIAHHFRLDISTASRQARALEEKGYVYRIPNPEDKRAYAFDITQAGSAQFEAYKQFKVLRIQKLLTGWSEAELHQFSKLLQKSNASFKTYDRGEL